MSHMTNLGRALIRNSSALIAKNRLSVLAAIGLAATAIPQHSANAALMLTLTSGSSSITITDQGVNDQSSTPGIIQYNTSSFDGLNLSISLAESNSPGTTEGTLSITSLDISSSTASQANPATLTLLASDTGYTMPGTGGSSMDLSSEIGGAFSNPAPGNQITFQSYVDPTNQQPASADIANNVSTPLQTFNNPTNSFDNTVHAPWTRGAGPYSLSDYMTIAIAAPGDYDNDTGITTASLSTSSLPDPSMGVIPVLAMGLLVRRRNARKA
jgi:hypothetical protein